jgi:hypothetical protein
MVAYSSEVANFQYTHWFNETQNFPVIRRVAGPEVLYNMVPWILCSLGVSPRKD